MKLHPCFATIFLFTLVHWSLADVFNWLEVQFCLICICDVRFRRQNIYLMILFNIQRTNYTVRQTDTGALWWCHNFSSSQSLNTQQVWNHSRRPVVDLCCSLVQKKSVDRLFPPGEPQQQTVLYVKKCRHLLVAEGNAVYIVRHKLLLSRKALFRGNGVCHPGNEGNSGLSPEVECSLSTSRAAMPRFTARKGSKWPHSR